MKMKMTMRTAIGVGAVGFGTGLHLLTAGHPVLAGSIGAAAVAWPVVRERLADRRAARSAAPAAAAVEAPAAVAA